MSRPAVRRRPRQVPSWAVEIHALDEPAVCASSQCTEVTRYGVMLLDPINGLTPSCPPHAVSLAAHTLYILDLAAETRARGAA